MEHTAETENHQTEREQIMKKNIELEVQELEQRVAPSIVLTNPGGNTPQSDNAANGQAVNYENPAGHAPPGQN